MAANSEEPGRAEAADGQDGYEPPEIVVLGHLEDTAGAARGTVPDFEGFQPSTPL